MNDMTACASLDSAVLFSAPVMLLQPKVENWVVVYAHGGLIADFDDEASARREAEQWAGICLRR